MVGARLMWCSVSQLLQPVLALSPHQVPAIDSIQQTPRRLSQGVSSVCSHREDVRLTVDSDREEGTSISGFRGQEEEGPSYLAGMSGGERESRLSELRSHVEKFVSAHKHCDP